MNFSNLSGKKNRIYSICHYEILPIFNVIYIYVLTHFILHCILYYIVHIKYILFSHNKLLLLFLLYFYYICIHILYLYL